MTDVSAIELRLGIEGRVRPVEDKTWPPCRGQDQSQIAVKWRVAQIEGNKNNNNLLCTFYMPDTVKILYIV